MARALDGRNQVMVDRLLAKRAERPTKTCFFAVGTLHYAGEEGIVALLAEKGPQGDAGDRAVSLSSLGEPPTPGFTYPLRAFEPKPAVGCPNWLWGCRVNRYSPAQGPAAVMPRAFEVI